MTKYEKAIKLMNDYCGKGKDNVIALATIACDENSDGKLRPSVRMVDAYYEEGVFYISTSASKKKMKEIEANPEVCVSGLDLFSVHGFAENLGWVKDEKNAEIRAKMTKYFDWFTIHADENNPDSIVLKVTLTDGVLTDNERTYDDLMYHVDFIKKEAV
ncbi:pyridoxamine 5''-phosphate oxidase [Erysipelothrix larvae]|uniref:Pyridoxamine 5''-phosphate oxidase n=1 Tax=Erysipelothrix larvae TaxID=1514105 RepID=A0A0X8GYX3_9FIRM|nr:pyridoxamine 5'-phosphate oxidase family protein [Erysipelothrix larvae]AMC92976.1 pyridoxamine 5''-phosphate oxidase [Erysipelothrix larvae]